MERSVARKALGAGFVLVGCLSFAGCSEDAAMLPAPAMMTAGTGVAGAPAAGSTGAAGVAGMTSTGAAAGASGAAGRAGSPAAGSGGAGMAGSTGAAGVAGAAGAAGGAAGAAAGSGGQAGAAGAAGGAGAAGMAGAPEPQPHEDLGKGPGTDVVTIGDSWMSNTLGTGNAIEGALQRLTMQRYRNYGVQGVLLTQSGLFGAAIPTQYDSAKRAGADIKTVIMTGGGNDIIQDATVQAACETGGDACVQTIMKINMTLNTLWTKMSADGVKDVVYIRYSDDAGSTADSIREMGRMPPPICMTGPIRCHSIETTEAVMADLIDGIHPSQAANNRIAKVVVDYMEKNGIRR